MIMLKKSILLRKVISGYMARAKENNWIGQ